MTVETSLLLYIIFLAVMVFVLYLLLTSVVKILPYEEGLLIVLGTFSRKLSPGLNIVPPVISNVVRMDLRTRRFSTVVKNASTKDNKIFDIDISVTYKVVDPEKAYFEIMNYREGTETLIKAMVQAVAGDLTGRELAWKRRTIEENLLEKLNEQVSLWGLKIENIDLDNVEMLAAEKDGLRYTNRIELAARIREKIHSETRKFGVAIESVEFGMEL